MQAHHNLFKLCPLVILDLFYAKVRFGCHTIQFALEFFYQSSADDGWTQVSYMTIGPWCFFGELIIDFSAPLCNRFCTYCFRHYQISRRQHFTTIANEDLDNHVRRLTHGNPSVGQRSVQGMLQAEGLTIQRERVAESLIRVDAASVAMRWCQAIKRRTYQVPGPNSLWHIDGNHKLIRYLQSHSLICRGFVVFFFFQIQSNLY